MYLHVLRKAWRCLDVLPTGSLTVSVKDRARLSKYAFGTKTADLHMCTACGVVPVVTSRIAGQLYAVVSVNAFEGVDPGLLRHAVVSFEAESEATRLERRRRYWIPAVRFDFSSATRLPPGAAGS